MPERSRPPLPGLASTRAIDRARARWGQAPARPDSEPPPPPPAAPARAVANDCDCEDVELRRAA